MTSKLALERRIHDPIKPNGSNAVTNIRVIIKTTKKLNADLNNNNKDKNKYLNYKLKFFYRNIILNFISIAVKKLYAKPVNI